MWTCRPPTGSQQEAIRRPLAGILQPSVGIPTCPLETNEDEDDEMIGHSDENDAELFPTSCQPSFHRDKTNEVLLADFTHDQTAFTTGSFAAAARMASTPFCSGIGPSSLPNIPWSTIRPTNENPEMKDLTSEEAEYSSACANAASFASTPSKTLSPIFEGSNEDSKSVNSSHSLSGSSRRGSCSTVSQHNGLELSKIQEETSSCQADTSRQDTNVGSAVINPFARDVVDAFLSRINPPLSAYEGFTVYSREMPKIATNVSVCFGRLKIVLFIRGPFMWCASLFTNTLFSLLRSSSARMKTKIAGDLLTASAREIKGGGTQKKRLWTGCSRISLGLSVLSFPSFSQDTITYFLVHLKFAKKEEAWQKRELIFVKS